MTGADYERAVCQSSYLRDMIRDLMIEHNFDLEDVAYGMNLSVDMFRSYLSGTNMGDMDFAMVLKIADAFGINTNVRVQLTKKKVNRDDILSKLSYEHYRAKTHYNRGEKWKVKI